MTYEVDYSCDNCGEHKQPHRGIAYAPGEMSPPYNIKINGDADLQGCIQWNDSGRVYRIHIHHVAGPEFLIHVDSAGPSGVFAGCGYLRFIDFTGDYYDLSVCLHSRRTHYLSYESGRPGIQRVMWSNESF